MGDVIQDRTFRPEPVHLHPGVLGRSTGRVSPNDFFGDPPLAFAGGAWFPAMRFSPESRELTSVLLAHESQDFLSVSTDWERVNSLILASGKHGAIVPVIEWDDGPVIGYLMRADAGIIEFDAEGTPLGYDANRLRTQRSSRTATLLLDIDGGFVALAELDERNAHEGDLADHMESEQIRLNLGCEPAIGTLRGIRSFRCGAEVLVAQSLKR